MTKVSERLDRHGESIGELKKEVRVLVDMVRILRQQILVLGPAAER